MQIFKSLVLLLYCLSGPVYARKLVNQVKQGATELKANLVKAQATDSKDNQLIKATGKGLRSKAPRTLSRSNGSAYPIFPPTSPLSTMMTTKPTGTAAQVSNGATTGIKAGSTNCAAPANNPYKIEIDTAEYNRLKALESGKMLVIDTKVGNGHLDSFFNTTNSYLGQAGNFVVNTLGATNNLLTNARTVQSNVENNFNRLSTQDYVNKTQTQVDLMKQQVEYDKQVKKINDEKAQFGISPPGQDDVMFYPSTYATGFLKKIRI